MASMQSKELTRWRIFGLKKYIKFKTFLHNLDYILIFFLALLLFSLISLLLFKQKGVQYSDHAEEISKLEMFDFTLHRLNTKQVDMIVKASKGIQYKDKELYIDFYGSRFNDDLSIETLEGKEVWHKGNEYDFVAGINYTKKPNRKFFSEKGVYNTLTEVFAGKGRFFIEDTDMITEGENIFYDEKTDTIRAKNIVTRLIR